MSIDEQFFAIMLDLFDLEEWALLTVTVNSAML